MTFEIVSKLENIEIIAVGNSIREITRLKRKYGDERWRKLKGFAYIQVKSDKILKAEIHWYEADGIGKREYKVKRILD